MIPLTGLGMVGLLGMAALAVDIGFWRYQQRLEQAAADSAAVAGAIRLNYPDAAATGSPQSAALAAASLNGYTDGSAGGVSVTVNVPPSPNAPSYPGATPYPPNTAVQVIVRKSRPQFYSAVFGSFSSGSARSVAVSSPDLSACLWQLNITDGYGIGITGNKPLETINCGVLANGTISVPGYYETTSVGYWGPNNPGGVGFTGAVSLATPVTDPCVRIPGCAYLASKPIPPQGAGDINGRTAHSLSIPQGQSYAVVDNCCANGTIPVSPGLYYFYGGISGTLQGDAVTLVNVNGTFTANGLGAAHPYFSAPASGPTVGVAFYQPPSNASSTTLDGGGNGTSAWDGLFYAPTAYGTSNGGSVTFATLVIGDILLHGGGSGLGVVVDPSLGGQISPFPAAYPTHVLLSE